MNPARAAQPALTDGNSPGFHYVVLSRHAVVAISKRGVA
jgi:hypothetical protein